MDEFIEKLLEEERFCEIPLPRLPKRNVLVSEGLLSPYESTLKLLPVLKQQPIIQSKPKILAKKVEREEAKNEDSDEYWLQLRKKIGID